MTWGIQAIFNFSIALPALAGLVRLRQMKQTYIPFVVMMVLGLISEIVSYLLIISHRSNQLVYVLFSLAEVLLLVYQFRRWGSFREKNLIFQAVLATVFLLWAIDFFAIGSIKNFNSFYLIIMSLLVIFLSIRLIPDRMLEQRNRLAVDPIFLICVALTAYYSVFILVEVFWMYGLNDSTFFRIKVQDLHTYVNAASNVIFALAIICTPTRSRFLQQ